MPDKNHYNTHLVAASSSSPLLTLLNIIQKKGETLDSLHPRSMSKASIPWQILIRFSWILVPFSTSFTEEETKVEPFTENSNVYDNSWLRLCGCDVHFENKKAREKKNQNKYFVMTNLSYAYLWCWIFWHRHTQFIHTRQPKNKRWQVLCASGSKIKLFLLLKLPKPQEWKEDIENHRKHVRITNKYAFLSSSKPRCDDTH